MTLATYAPVANDHRSILDSAQRIAAAVAAGAWRGRRRHSASHDLIRVIADEASGASTRAEVIRVLGAADPGVADDCVRRAGVLGVAWFQTAILTGAVAGGLHAAVHAMSPDASASVMRRLGAAAAAVAAAENSLSAATRAVDATRRSADDAELLAHEAATAVLSAALTAEAAQAAVSAALRDASDARLEPDTNARIAFWITAVSRPDVDPDDAEHLGRTLVSAAF